MEKNGEPESLWHLRRKTSDEISSSGTFCDKHENVLKRHTKKMKERKKNLQHFPPKIFQLFSPLKIIDFCELNIASHLTFKIKNHFILRRNYFKHDTPFSLENQHNNKRKERNLLLWQRRISQLILRVEHCMMKYFVGLCWKFFTSCSFYGFSLLIAWLKFSFSPWESWSWSHKYFLRSWDFCNQYNQSLRIFFSKKKTKNSFFIFVESFYQSWFFKAWNITK